MTKTELNGFRRALGKKIAEIGSGNREALAIETTSDELDRVQNANDRDYAMGNLERNSGRLRQVQAALGRLDAGTFGVCIGCDEDINLKRLAAVPWTSYCIVCQELEDRGAQTPVGDEIDTPHLVAA
jgi:DnaK suppressor protein